MGRDHCSSRKDARVWAADRAPPQGLALHSCQAAHTSKVLCLSCLAGSGPLKLGRCACALQSACQPMRMSLT